jgi:probable rRNA maturation factor
MALVVNLQRKVKLETSSFKEFISTLSAVIEELDGREFSVAFISDRRMTELNGFFRGKDSTTDVLSFPHEPDEFTSAYEDAQLPSACGELRTVFLGDIVISVEQAQKQAKENKLTLENEIKQLILHGLLHLCGYDHETDDGEMNRRELELRAKLKIR